MAALERKGFKTNKLKFFYELDKVLKREFPEEFGELGGTIIDVAIEEALHAIEIELREVEQKKQEYVLACGRLNVNFRIVKEKGNSIIWWINTKTNALEKQQLPDDFNIHDWKFKGMNETTTSYILELKEKEKTWKLELPFNVYDSLKANMGPRRGKDVPELEILIKHSGERKTITPEMEKIWNVLVESKEKKLPRTAIEIADMADITKQTVYNHLKFFMSKNWVKKSGSRYSLIDFD